MKYAEQLQLDSRFSVFWINATGKKAFVESFHRIALKLPRRTEQDIRSLSQLQMIRELIEDAQYGPWLMVLDGADDKDIFLEERDGLPALSSCIPRAAHGRELITITDSQIAGLGEDPLTPVQNGMKILPLPLKEGVDLLRNSIPTELHNELGVAEESKCERLVKLLDGLPIALHHASALIRADQISLDEFIQSYVEIQQSSEPLNHADNIQAGLVTFELSY